MTPGAYDIVVLAALVTGFVRGRSRGFAWQLSGIATLVIGYVAAAIGSGSAARLFPQGWPDDLRRYAGWVGIYALVSLGIYLVTLKLSKKIKEHELEDLDKNWGGALGTFKAALFVAVVSLIAVAASVRARDLVRESVTGPYLARAALVARPLLPERIASALDKCVGQILPTTPEDEPSPEPAPPTTAPSKPQPPTRTAPAPTKTAPTKTSGTTTRPTGSRPARTARAPGLTNAAPAPVAPSPPAPVADTDPVLDEPADALPEDAPRTPGKEIEPEPDPFDVPAADPVDPLAPTTPARPR